MAEKAPVDSSGTARLRALVRGRVQGVFFRQHAREHATRLGLVGCVRNLSDGATVEVLAEGPRDALDALVSELRKGPPAAHVVEVDTDWGEATGEWSSFQVL